MSLLSFRTTSRPVPAEPARPADTTPQMTGLSIPSIGLIGECANSGCRSGWLHLFRKHSRPIFEGGWTCSPACTEARVQSAVRRELEGRTGYAVHRHRIPLGLLLLEQGWITHEQLRKALEAQKGCGSGRLGEWLVKQDATDEATVTRALGLQWSCPVLSPDAGAPGSFASIMPRLFLDAFGAIPLRVMAGKILYLGFEESLDPVVALAVERMTGLRVESGMVQSSFFRPALASLLSDTFPSLQLAEAVSESAAAHLLARTVERADPLESRLARVHDFLWMRMYFSHRRSGLDTVAAVKDVVCTIGTL